MFVETTKVFLADYHKFLVKAQITFLSGVIIWFAFFENFPLYSEGPVGVFQCPYVL